MENNFVKFKLVGNYSKHPSSDWAKRNGTKKWAKDIKGNHGVPTGKVNNILGFDIDYYKWGEDHLFKKFIGNIDIKKWALKTNTYTVETANGGLHLYFKYDPNFSCRDNSELHIDIKADGGYLVGANSKVYKKDNKTIGEYKILNNASIIDMPEDLKNWCLENVYTKEEKKNKKDKKIMLDNDTSNYSYDFTTEEIRKIIEGLPELYFKDNYFKGKWGIFTNAMKTLDRRDLWNEYSLKFGGDKYDENNNNKLWNKTNIENYDMVNKLINDTSYNIENLVKYNKYKPVNNYNLNQNHTSINRKKLDKMLNVNYDNDFIKIDSNLNYVIKSDTGTGKTTLFKNYIKNNPDLNFISIVSRVSLADAQYESFCDTGIDNLHHYNISHSNYFNQNDNVIITIDSINKLQGIKNFDNYVIFLDEFNSMIEYLWTCNNLNNKRVICFKTLIKLLSKSKHFICVDADITNHCLKLLNFINKPYELIINSYKHNQGVKCTELFDYQEFIKQAKKFCNKKGVLIPCDSKRHSKCIFDDLTKDFKIQKERTENINIDDKNNISKQIKIINGVSYCLINSETDEYIDLDTYDVVIFSPKIVYGIDSTRERPVMAHYSEKTINPKQMKQQIARNRNIEHLYYIFYNKKFYNAKYKTLSDTYNELNNINNLAEFNILATDEETKLYLDILSEVKYIEDCFNTNIYRHFKLLLKQSGFIDTDIYKQTDNSHLQDKIEQIDYYELNNFDKDESFVEKINEYLEIPSDKIKDYKELFLEQNKLINHFSISNFFFKSEKEWDEKIECLSDFKINKILSNSNKLKFLKKVMLECGIKDKTTIDSQKLFSKEKQLKFIEEYSLMFRDRKKTEIKLNTKYDINKFLYNIAQKLFGSKLFDREQIQKNNKREYKYKINNNIINKHLNIYKFRNSDQKIEGVNYEFGKEELNSLEYIFD